MERLYDIAHVVILVLFLIVAGFINNAIVKGILLLIFSAILVYSTITKIKMVKKNGKLRSKVFYGILLFLDSVLALGSLYVVISAIVEAV